MNTLIFASAKPDGVPRFRDHKWKEVFEAQPASNPLRVIRDTLTNNLPRFSLPLGEDRVPWSVWLAPEALWKRVTTLSQIALLEGEALARFRASFDEILRLPDVERDGQGRVLTHGVTYMAWCDRI